MIQRTAVMPVDYSRNFARQWLLLILMVASGLGFYWYQTHVYRPRPVPPSTSNPSMRSWFYVLHMPEMQIHSDVRTSRQQLAGWVETLQHEGFHFLLLSEVLRQLNEGVALPDKTAVIMFDPGFRHTADTYMPVLSERNIPAVWLTNGKGIEAKDKRYVSQHVVEVMQNSGLWDIGYYTSDQAISLQTRNHQTLVLGYKTPWKTDAGRFALNRGTPGESLDRLNINPKWTAVDLLNRLLVERPVQGSMILSLQQIQGRNWGIGVDLDSPRESHFTLRSPADKRSGSLYWLGTQGLNDVHLRVEVKSLIGEMRVLLRSDPAAGEDVSIVFARGKVSISQTKKGRAETLSTVACPDIAPNTPFNAVLAVMGKQLALAVNTHPLIALETLSEPTSNKGMIRLVVQDSLQGVGEARSVRIICTPLGKK